MIGWIIYKTAVYAFIPACTYVISNISTSIGTTLGTQLGLNILNRIWRITSDKLRGSTTITLKCSRTYIVHNGEVINIDPSKQYTIIRGKLTVTDLCANKRSG